MLKPKSSSMKFFIKIGLEKIAWALRRLYCPVSSDALVLEVGSGGNPYARANVLLDAYENTRERHWVPLKSDRPTVLGFVENLPFKDKSFDFVIASHVLEHSPHPERFLSELQRVAKAGYIEVPDAFMERVNPYHDHRLEITVRGKQLLIRKKSKPIVDETLNELYSDRAKKYIAANLIPKHPFAFHVRYYWSENIDFVVINPETNASWVPTKIKKAEKKAIKTYGVRDKIRDVLRYFMSQTKRNSNIDLLSLLQCPICHSDNLVKYKTILTCQSCQSSYELSHGITKMYLQKK